MTKRARIRRVGVVSKPRSRRAGPVLRRLLKQLEAHGVRPVLDREAARVLGRAKDGLSRADLAREVEMVVAVGGDGTILSIARHLGRSGPPVLGINLGSLGFLADFSMDELEESMEPILAGHFQVDRRMMLAVELHREEGPPRRYRVLNDAVINKSALARILDIELTVDGQEITIYRADGLILSTPTGSTAYCLSAGGPIVHPGIQAIIVTPICPHTLTNRPLVVPGDLVLEGRIRTGDENAFLTLDGQVGIPLTREDRIRVRRSSLGTRMVTLPGRNYFQILQRKLKWGTRVG